MSILLVHFIPAVIASIIIYKLVSRYSGGSQWLNIGFRVIFLVAAFVAFRPFFLAFIMLNSMAMGIYLSAIIAFSLYRFKSISDSLTVIVKIFVATFPVYMIVTILVFSSVKGSQCELTEKTAGLVPIFSICDKSKLEIAETYTHHVYHCRSAFYNPKRDIVYITFGAETNPDKHTLLGVNLLNDKIEREISTYTVFRGYCPADSSTCLHLIPPESTLRFWDDDKQETIRDYDLGVKNRPRFFSPDVEKPIIYVATLGNTIEVADMQKHELLAPIVMPTDSILTVDNTKKKVVATVNHFLRPYLMIYDKETGNIETMSMGVSRMWKHWGHFFHLAVDAGNERVFVAASFECAIYEIDPESRKILWRMPMPIGIRDMTFDTKRGYLLASNFINGYVYIIDLSGKNPRILDKFFAGRRLRYFNYEADTDVFLLASGNGFYMFEPALADVEGYRSAEVEPVNEKEIQ